MDAYDRAGVSTAGTPTRRREALDRAWTEAMGAEHADASSRYDDRDTRIQMAMMWALIALAEKE